MKTCSIVLMFLLIMGCSQQGQKGEAVGGSVPEIPIGAMTESLEDTPGLTRVTLNDNNGKVAMGGFYLNQKREGSWVEYHPNGMIKTITTYVGGKKEGMFAEFSETGQTVRRCLYHNDQRDGEYREYNYSTVKEERFYKGGKLEGAVRIYYPDGKIMEEGLYVNGVRDGISKWYDQQGNLTIQYEYKEGTLVKK